MIKYIPITLIFTLILSCSENKDVSKIIIETNGIPDSIIFYLINWETERKDSGYVVNNHLIFNNPVNKPTEFILKTNFPTNNQSMGFWVEDKDLTIRINDGSFEGAKIEGSDIQIIVDSLAACKAVLNKTLDSIKMEYRATSKDLADRRNYLRSEGRKIEEEILEIEKDYIRKNPGKLYSAIKLKELMKYDIPRELTKEFYYELTPEIQKTDVGLIINRFITLNQDIQIGDSAIDFQLKNLEGEMVSLSDHHGKYILLDFWASNCGPCLIEMPSLLENYNAYHSKGFEIIGVCLDKNRDAWEKTVKKYNVNWTTVSDLQGADGDAPISYNIYFMPTYFLINPEGIIIDKIMGRGHLNEKLKSIFNESRGLAKN